MTLQEILMEVQKATAPHEMGVREAREFVEELIGELEMTLDALEHDEA